MKNKFSENLNEEHVHVDRDQDRNDEERSRAKKLFENKFFWTSGILCKF